MTINTLGRREFVRLSLLAGVFGLTSCGFSSSSPILFCPNGVLPKEWLQTLPKPWKVKSLRLDSGLHSLFTSELLKDIDLIALGDGWLSSISNEGFQPITLEDSSSRLNEQGKSFLLSLERPLAEKIILAGMSPWVMLFRNGDPWQKQANESWEVLLEPELQGNIVFPNSARVVISIANSMGGGA